MKLVSACLLGACCNYEAKSWLNPKLLKEFEKGKLFPVCPEVLGGLSVPRAPAEIVNGDGNDVLNGKDMVMNIEGVDVTNQFIKGACETLAITKAVGAKEARKRCSLRKAHPAALELSLMAHSQTNSKLATA